LYLPIEPPIILSTQLPEAMTSK